MKRPEPRLENDFTMRNRRNTAEWAKKWFLMGGSSGGHGKAGNFPDLRNPEVKLQAWRLAIKVAKAKDYLAAEQVRKRKEARSKKIFDLAMERLSRANSKHQAE